MQLNVETSARHCIEDITDDVRDAVPDSVDRGVCTVFVRHTTAGVCVNERERRLLDDVEDALDRLVPADGDYAHDQIDDNAHAHLRSLLLPSSVTVPVTGGDLDLGTWQSVLLVESDGPQTRTVDVRVTTASRP